MIVASGQEGRVVVGSVLGHIRVTIGDFQGREVAHLTLSRVDMDELCRRVRHGLTRDGVVSGGVEGEL